jgi:hypothetical protein
MDVPMEDEDDGLIRCAVQRSVERPGSTPVRRELEARGWSIDERRC